jgi:hypothetical protein
LFVVFLWLILIKIKCYPILAHQVNYDNVCLTFYLKVVLYKMSSSMIEKEHWVYVDYQKKHTHDIRALTVAVPISQEGLKVLSYNFLLFTL